MRRFAMGCCAVPVPKKREDALRAHRASLLGVLAARPVVMHVDCYLCHLAELRAAMMRIDQRRARTGTPRLDVRINIVPESPLACAHPMTATVQPQIGDRLGRIAQICRCCGSFRRRIGCTWGPWELSAPDVDDGRPWPDGVAFLIQEVSNA